MQKKTSQQLTNVIVRTSLRELKSSRFLKHPKVNRLGRKKITVYKDTYLSC